MALTPGRRTVNRAHGRPSWITIKSDTDLFGPDTTISVFDQDGNKWSANAMNQKDDKKTLPIKLKGLQTALAHAAPAAAAALTGVEDTGQLTVTVTSVIPQQSVDVPVSYVDDPNP